MSICGVCDGKGCKFCDHGWQHGDDCRHTAAAAVLDEPYTYREIIENIDGDGMVSGNVLVYLDEILHCDLDSFYDLLSERLIDSCVGMQIDGEPVGVLDGAIIMKVTLDPSMFLDDDDHEGDNT